MPSTTKRKAAGAPQAPLLYAPQLATLASKPPVGPLWVHELKYDGYRMGCIVEGDRLRIESRSGQDWTSTFPEVVAGVRQLDVQRAVFDGEVAVLLEDGRTSFQGLQNAIARRGSRGLVYIVFDLLHLNGRDVGGLPFAERKRELARLLERAPGVLRYSEHFEVAGASMLRSACELGAEGIVSKRVDQPYRPGRNEGWYKTKCVQRQEFVVGGFTDPKGSRVGIGSLLIGYYNERHELVFAGKVGTGPGFTAAYTAKLRAEFNPLERDVCPFSPRPLGWLGKHAHWVEPVRVVEVTFTEFTGDGSVRHPSLQGFRTDKAASEVVREVAAAAPLERAKTLGQRPKVVTAGAVLGVPITHGERMVYPNVGLTKQALAEYYASIAAHMLPHVVGRPLTLVRCLKDVSADDAPRSACTFLRHSAGMNAWAPPTIERVQIPELKKVGEYLVVRRAEDLVSLVQGNIVELHCWNARVEEVERPDMLVFDLDPGPGITWKQVLEAGRIVRGQLEHVGLPSWPKLTGGKGLHVAVPLEPELTWADAYRVTKLIAESLVKSRPDLFVASFAKGARAARILIDVKRNHRGAIVVAGFSTRARPAAPVALPVAWEELKLSRPSDYYTTQNVAAFLRDREDPWVGFWKSRQRLTKALRRAR